MSIAHIVHKLERRGVYCAIRHIPRSWDYVVAVNGKEHTIRGRRAARAFIDGLLSPNSPVPQQIEPQAGQVGLPSAPVVSFEICNGGVLRGVRWHEPTTAHHRLAEAIGRADEKSS